MDAPFGSEMDTQIQVSFTCVIPTLYIKVHVISTYTQSLTGNQLLLANYPLFYYSSNKPDTKPKISLSNYLACKLVHARKLSRGCHRNCNTSLTQ